MYSQLSAGLCLSFYEPLRQERIERWNIIYQHKQQHQYTPVIPTCTICISHTLWLVLTCTHSLRSHCSMRRWQYWKAFSLNRSFGGSRRLEEEVAETIETTDPSTSERSSVAQQREFVSEKSELWAESLLPVSEKCTFVHLLIAFTCIPVRHAGARLHKEEKSWKFRREHFKPTADHKRVIKGATLQIVTQMKLNCCTK